MGFVIQLYCRKCKAPLPGGKPVEVDPVTGHEIRSDNVGVCKGCQQKREETHK